MTQGKKRLFLIDGTALAYRSYFAFIRNPLINSKGENTSASYAFTNTLLKLIREERPEYIAVAFDTGKPTFRHVRFPEYKATRQKMPEDMYQQIPRIYQIVEAMGLPVLEAEGFEADDIIGTLTERASGEGFEVLIVAGDKDFMQLVSSKVKMLVPGGRKGEIELMDKDAVLKKMGVGPELVTDVLALMGDSSDNVPGVPGVGEKTAKSLVSELGNIESILENPENIRKEKLRELIGKYADQARLSKELVTISKDVPVDVKVADLKFSGFDREELCEIFKDLEFTRFLKEVTESPEAQRNYQLVSEESVDQLVDKIKSAGKFVIDTETTGLNPMRVEIVGISISTASGEGYYIPVGHRDGPNVDLELVISKLKPLLEDESLQKCGQNVKYDTVILRRYGIETKGFVFDPMIASYLLNPSERQHNLDVLSLEHLNYKPIPIADLIGSGRGQISFAEVPVDKAAEYSSEDADITFRLWEVLRPKLEEKKLLELFEKVEMPLVDVLREMEMNGVSIDVDLLKEISAEMALGLGKLEVEIYRIAGEEFNINSTKQLGQILFEKLKLPTKRKTKTGYSTGVDILEELAREHELPGKVLEYRQLAKLKSTYVDALPELVNPDTGRIHTSFNQTVTATGRLSSSDPNLQNIPIRTEIGSRIRKAFIPADSSWVILSADYSQIELRLMAHLSGDSTLVESFRKGEDVHTKTASIMFGIFPQLVTPDLRRQAKTINFGIMYGMGPYGFSQRLGVTLEEARKFIDSYFATYPGVKDYMEKIISEAKKKGYVTTMLGRRRYLPEMESSNSRVREFAERTAINTPLQGTAADLIKVAMVNIHGKIKERKMSAKMILQVHDELVFEVPEPEVEELRSLAVEEMESALELSVPIKVDVGVGGNWLEAH